MMFPLPRVRVDFCYCDELSFREHLNTLGLYGTAPLEMAFGEWVMHAARGIGSEFGQDIIRVVFRRREQSFTCVEAPGEDPIDLIEQTDSLASHRSNGGGS